MGRTSRLKSGAAAAVAAATVKKRQYDDLVSFESRRNCNSLEFAGRAHRRATSAPARASWKSGARSCEFGFVICYWSKDMLQFPVRMCASCRLQCLLGGSGPLKRARPMRIHRGATQRAAQSLSPLPSPHSPLTSHLSPLTSPLSPLPSPLSPPTSPLSSRQHWGDYVRFFFHAGESLVEALIRERESTVVDA